MMHLGLVEIEITSLVSYLDEMIPLLQLLLVFLLSSHHDAVERLLVFQLRLYLRIQIMK